MRIQLHAKPIHAASPAWRPSPALRSFESEILTALCITGPLVWLVWRRGGVDAFDQAVVFGWILLVLGLLALFRPKRLRRVRWPLALLAVLPLLQLVPLGSYRKYFLPNSQLNLLEQAHAAGIEPFTTSTIYPYATLQSALVIAGCCGLFILSRSMVSRSQRSFLICAVILFAIAMAESASGLEQYLRAQVDDAATFTGAHGTFVNKNHFSALLEGCFGLTLGVLLACLTRARASEPSRQWLSVIAAIAAGSCLLGVVLSYSRAGIVVILAMGLVAGVIAISTTRRLSTALVPAAALTATLATLNAMGGWKERFLDVVDAPAPPVRLSIWQDTLRGAQDHWLTGSGLGTFPYAFQRSAMYLPQKTVDYAHNDYLQWLLELGIPGAALLIGCLGFVFITTIRSIRGTPSHPLRMYAMGALLGAGGILTHAWVDFPLQIPAIAALTSLLLGCASGLALLASPRKTASSRKVQRAGTEPQAQAWGQLRQTQQSFRSAKFARFASGLFGLGYAVLAVLLANGTFDDWNAEIHHAAGQQAFQEGRLAEAADAWNLALSANPRAAAIWLKRAELADAARDVESAVRYAEIAAQIEPFTLRVEWPLAHLRLKAGAEDRAAVGLKTIAAGLPSLRPAVLQAAWAAGLDAERIADLSVRCDQKSFAGYVAFLARREDWAGIIPAAEALSTGCAPFLSAEALRPAFDRLFKANQGEILKKLWGVLRKSQLLPRAGSNVLTTSATGGWPLPLPQAGGAGWIARPAVGVTVSNSRDRTGSALLLVEFKQPRNIHYRHLTRDFSVKPRLAYSLQAEIRTEQLRGSEGMRVMVSSPKRFISSSRPIAKTTPWRAVTLEFVTEPGEEIIRVVIARNRGQRPGNLITGKFFLRNLHLRQQPPRQRILNRPEERPSTFSSRPRAQARVRFSRHVVK